MYHIRAWYTDGVPNGKSPAIERAASGNLEWVHVSSNRKREIDILQKRYGFHPIDLEETRPPLQRPKLVVRPDYIFMILLYPVFDRKTRTIYSSEVDFFISKGRLVTVNNDNLEPLKRLFDACKRTDAEAAKVKKLCMVGDVAHLMYSILSEILEEVFPMLLHLNLDIDKIETRLFRDYEKDLIEELLRVKTNVVNVRKAIQGHKNVIRQLIHAAESRFPIGELQAYFEKLVEQTKELWDMLELQRDTVNALHETNASLIDYRINEIMKTLTIFSVIMFPLTLIAATFGMNAVNMPFVDSPYGFWIVLGLMAFGGLCMLLFFKRKKWI